MLRKETELNILVVSLLFNFLNLYVIIFLSGLSSCSDTSKLICSFSLHGLVNNLSCTPHPPPSPSPPMPPHLKVIKGPPSLWFLTSTLSFREYVSSVETDISSHRRNYHDYYCCFTGFMPCYFKDVAFLKDPKLFDPDRPVRPHRF
jgi:hypothetical protein